MDIKEALESEHSNAQSTKIATYIENHPHKLEELMNCFFSSEFRLCQRAAWPLSKIGSKMSDQFIPYLPKMLEHIQSPVHDAAIRNTVRILQDIEIPEKLIGPVYELCFDYLISPKVPVAIKVFSMTTLANIAQHFPDLVPELILAIEDNIPHSSAGYNSRAKKELKRLRKIAPI
jgi:hypothetical protein